MQQENPFAAPNAPVNDILDNESTGSIKLLTPKGRMGRVRYFYYSILSSFISMMLIGLGAFLASKVNTTVGGIIIFIAYLGMFILSFFYLIQRCHDLNKSGWWSLLVFIPFAIFYFYFAAGTPGANHFGLKPPKNSKGVIAGAILLPILYIVLMTAASTLITPQLIQSMEQIESEQSISE